MAVWVTILRMGVDYFISILMAGIGLLGWQFLRLDDAVWLAVVRFG